MPHRIKKIFLNVQIVNQSRVSLNTEDIKSWVQAVWGALSEEGVLTGSKKKKQTLVLAFLSVREMQKLNHQFRKKNKPTDILSFAELQSDPALGELALCPAVISKSRPKNFSKNQWMHYLILHGLLHLLGFEHEGDKKSAQKMYQLQDKLFSQLKSNPV